MTKLRNAGRLLGETFQIRDDWLGSFGDPDRTGKGRTSDLARRKLTYPVVSAFSRASYAEQRRSASSMPSRRRRTGRRS